MSSPAFVIGNLTRTPQLSRTTDGTPEVNLTLAENSRRLVEGEWVDGPTTSAAPGPSPGPGHTRGWGPTPAAAVLPRRLHRRRSATRRRAGGRRAGRPRPPLPGRMRVHPSSRPGRFIVSPRCGPHATMVGVVAPAEGLARLRAAAASGELDALCERHGVRVLTVFGSVARGEPRARDLDVGVISEPDVPFDPVLLINDLADLTGVGDIDLAHLNRGGPVIRERALVGAVPLFENGPGRYADAQTAAIGERIETDAMRRMDLDLLTR